MKSHGVSMEFHKFPPHRMKLSCSILHGIPRSSTKNFTRFPLWNSIGYKTETAIL